MEQVKGIAPRPDKTKEIWEVENWGRDEWTEQALAEVAFSKAMNVQWSLEPDNLTRGQPRFGPRRCDY